MNDGIELLHLSLRVHIKEEDIWVLNEILTPFLKLVKLHDIRVFDWDRRGKCL